MPRQRRVKSLLVWEPFLLGVIILAALAASLTARLGIAGVIVGVLASLLVIPAIVQLVRLGLREGGGRNSSRLLATIDGFTLVDAPTQGTLVLDGTNRRQDSIDLALAWTSGEIRAVLWPRAPTWLGRELRVEAYFLGSAHPIRAGFLPRASDQSDVRELEHLLERGILVVVPAIIRGDGKQHDPAREFTRLQRPFTVEVGHARLNGLLVPGA